MRPATLLPLTLLFACSDYGLQAPEGQNEAGIPMIDVSPRELDFLSAAAGETVIRTFTVANVGDAFLQVQSIELQATASFTLVDAPTAVGLLPGEGFDVDVAFTPLDAGPVDGTVQVRSTDADEPEIPVALLGDGRIPSLQITPASFDFGDQVVPCPADLDLVLQNVGEAELTVEDLGYSGDADLSLVFAPSLPLVLAPGAYATATVRYLPTVDDTVSGVLTARSNDPAGDRSASQAGTGTLSVEQSESFPVLEDPPVDILFAVDQSESMDDDAVRLGAGFADFIARVGASTSGWQVGVVTLDAACLNGGVLRADSPDLVSTFEAAVVLGTDAEVSDDEALLKLSDGALAQTGTGACNEGLLRDGTSLHVIVVSDEPERSHEQAAAWTWDFWLERMQGRVASPELLTISGLVDANGCNEGDDGYAQAIEATGGERLDICAGDWGASMAALADASLRWAWSYPLSGDPAPSSIAVTVDGTAATDWTWDEAAHAVVFADRPAGATVTVTYVEAGTCP